MRKAYLLLAIAICVASPFALAQTRDSSAQSTAVATTVRPQAADAGTEHAAAPRKSAFGQVMTVLTNLLQEAATKQSGTQSDATLPGMTSENSALTITVTPIEGRTTFAVDDTAQEATAPADDPSADVQIDIDSAQLAVQGEDGAG